MLLSLESPATKASLCLASCLAANAKLCSAKTDVTTRSLYVIEYPLRPTNVQSIFHLGQNGYSSGGAAVAWGISSERSFTYEVHLVNLRAIEATRGKTQQRSFTLLLSQLRQSCDVRSPGRCYAAAPGTEA